ncbi:MAG: hypothetical protein ACOC5E_01890 [Acidobacteriota bacterium]
MRTAGPVGAPCGALACLVLVLGTAGPVGSAIAQEDVFFRSADARVVTFDGEARFGDLERTRLQLDGPYEGSYQFVFRALASSGQAPPGRGLRGRPRYAVIWTCQEAGDGSRRLGRAKVRGDNRGNAFVARNLDASGCDDVRVDVVHRGNATIPEGGSLLEEGQAVRISGNGFGPLTDSQPGSPCIPDANTLCLQEGRFAVNVEWSDDGRNDTAAAGAQRTPEDGLFWFFNRDNHEILVKVLDACPSNDRFWVFAGGVTNLALRITVTDVQTGRMQQYANGLNQPFPAITDTNAFATCP